MITDVVISLQNGYENRGIIVPYLYKYNYYDCCVKIGNDIVPQKIVVDMYLELLDVIPVIILKAIPCLIGIESIIDIKNLKEDIKKVEKYLDIGEYLFFASNTCILYNDIQYYLSEIDPSIMLNILGFVPNIIPFNDFIGKYKHPLIEGAGGFNNFNGEEYNRFKSDNITQSTIALSYLNPRYIGNIIGVINIFDVSKNYININNNNKILYNFINSCYTDENQILYHDYLLNYNWLNLDKINNAIKRLGINIICCYGINLIQSIEKLVIKTDDTEKEFDNVRQSKQQIKGFIIDYLKQKSNITEILFF